MKNNFLKQQVLYQMNFKQKLEIHVKPFVSITNVVNIYTFCLCDVYLNVN